MKLDWFLIGMAIAFAAALVFPDIGADGGLLHLGIVTQIGIAAIFFLHGAGLSPLALMSDAGRWRLHIFIQATTFILFPLIGAGVYFGMHSLLPEELRLGFFFLCSLSSTISSSVALVAMSGGAVPAAIFNATLSGLIGMFVTPCLLALISVASAAPLSFWPSLLDIFLKLLLPFLTGQAARQLFGGFAESVRPLIGKLDRVVILLIVYSAFCNATLAGVWRRYDAAVIATVFVFVAALLAIAIMFTMIGSRRLGFSRADEIAAVFCGVTKSLANGAPIAKIMFGAHPMLGMIMLPLLLYHPLQLVVCSALAKSYLTAKG